MIDLNKDISQLTQNSIIIYKLKKLNITKLGHLFLSSHSELLYSELFTVDQLNNIEQILKSQSLDYIYNMNLDNINYLKRKAIRFNLNTYQNILSSFHLLNSGSEPLYYSDSIAVAKPLFHIYRLINETKDLNPTVAILLNQYLFQHPMMTIADFVDINPNLLDEIQVRTIAKVLGISFNRELPYEEMFKQENKVFNGDTVQNEQLDIYQMLSTLTDEELENYLKEKPTKKLTKSLTN